jgi:hypothetical protein
MMNTAISATTFSFFECLVWCSKWSNQLTIRRGGLGPQ